MEQIHRQIISYLPYGVKCEILNYKSDYVGLRYSTLNGFYDSIGEPHFTYDGGSTGKSIRDMKIILRPLSDLTKEIEVNGENFVPLKKLNDDGLGLITYSVYVRSDNTIALLANYNPGYNCLSENDAKSKLLEWNFDLYGLIESDNAININTL
jgi:hypothetical protein